MAGKINSKTNGRSTIRRQLATRSLVAFALSSVALLPSAHAAVLSWDPGLTPATPSGGTGTWDVNTTANWSNGATDQTWTDTTGTSDAATFAGSAGTVTLASSVGATGITFSTTGYTLTETSAGATLSAPISVPTGISLAINSNSGGIVLAGSLSGAGIINESGANLGATHLSGDNSAFTGIFTSNGNGAHRVKFDSASSGSAGAAWTLNDANIDGNGFTFGTGTISFGSLSGGGYFRNDASGTNVVTISVGALNTDSSFTGTVVSNHAADIALTKVGTGTFSFGNTNNSYGGDTTISAGTLLLTNANAVKNSKNLLITGGTLSSNIPASTGTITANNISLSNGALSLDGTGVGSVTLNAGKSFSMSGGALDETIASPSSFDQLFANAATPGTFSITGGTLDLSSSAGIDYTQSYDLFAGFSSGAVSNLNILGYDSANYTASLSPTGVLSFTPTTPVPEPASLSLLAFAVTPLLLKRRRSIA